MMRFPSPPRRAVVAFGLVVMAFGAPADATGQTTDTTAATAIPSQDGWWNRAKGQQPNEPANPLRTNVGGAIPAPSTVPASGLGVGAAGGDADKVAAIGLVLDAGLDPLVDSLILTLKETPENGSNLNAGSAKIVACPITAFWGGAKDGDWVNRPTCDEGQSVAGVRGADGTWTFDLTLMATQWVDPTSGLDQNGVLLVESVDAPMSFQVSFSDIASGKVTTAFSAMPGFGDDEFTSDESFQTFEEEVATEETFTDPAFDSGSSATFDDGATFSTDPSTTFSSSTSAPTVAPVAEVAASASVAGPIRAANLFGALPFAAIVLLLLALVGAALMLGAVLGPLPAPAVASARTGGVSRALAARAAAGDAR